MSGEPEDEWSSRDGAGDGGPRVIVIGAGVAGMSTGATHR